jgi:hypothetical protein
MQFTKNTSISKKSNYSIILIKVALISITIFISVILLNKIDFPSPNKDVEKNIPNENLKIVK